MTQNTPKKSPCVFDRINEDENLDKRATVNKEQTRLTTVDEKTPDDSSTAPEGSEFSPRDGGCLAWVVCATSFWANGTLFGILNIFGIVFVALKRNFESSGDENLSFKLGV